MNQDQKLKFDDELRAQESVVFIWRAGHVAAAALALLIGYNGHGFVMLLMLVCQGIVNLVKWPPIRDELIRRQKIVAFRQQIENIYVFNQSEFEGDDNSVAQTFNDTLEWLRLSSNQHEVRVHMALFRDVVVFTSYYDAAGRRHDERTWREKSNKKTPDGIPFYPASETWDQFIDWRTNFVLEDRDKRLRQLRTDNRGFDWVNENYFRQEYVGG